MTAEHVDVLIVGAGLSGIGAAHHLQQACPQRSYAIVESRADLGGTWDLFRYPGVRSDSDMYTLGYQLRPWSGGVAIADGSSILQYICATAAEQGIDRHIRFSLRVVRAQWSSAQAGWTVHLRRTDGDGEVVMTCSFLYCCSGYYRYDEGYTPELPGLDRFAGPVVHPQFWPPDLDYAGKKVVVIGSGATAVTLVPALAETAERVTMLQRSPGYIASLPGSDRIAALARHLPAGPAFRIVRWKNILTTSASYRASRRWPGLMKKVLVGSVRRQLPDGFDVEKHFTPRYDPWDQRLCVVPDGDLFRAIRQGKADVVTGVIESFTPDGVLVSDGTEIKADIVVTATGLNMLAFGGIELEVDGEPVDLPDTMAYKSLMLTGVPNFAFAIGYTNASWTLKVDLASQYVCRLLNHLADSGQVACVPVRDEKQAMNPLLDFQAGYVLRSMDTFPKQGSEVPWRVTMNYLRDRRALRRGSITDHMRFQNR